MQALVAVSQSNEKERDQFGVFTEPTPIPGTCEIVDINEELLSQFFHVDVGSLPPAGEAELQCLSGISIPEGAASFSHRYGGYQFGSWSGQLGDGRVVSWGMQEAHKESPLRSLSANGHWDWQLKGSGKTPFSRDGDGRAVSPNSISSPL